jgi:hypothetical protein
MNEHTQIENSVRAYDGACLTWVRYLYQNDKVHDIRNPDGMLWSRWHLVKVENKT